MLLRERFKPEKSKAAQVELLTAVKEPSEVKSEVKPSVLTYKDND